MFKHTGGTLVLGLLLMTAVRTALAVNPAAVLVTTPVQHDDNVARPTATLPATKPTAPTGATMVPRVTSPVTSPALRPLGPSAPAGASSTGLPALMPINQVVSPAAEAARAKANQTRQLDIVGMLRRENKQLKALIQNLEQRVQEARNDKPFCANRITSANHSGATLDCSPYACDQGSGTCKLSCTVTEDCATGGDVCDTALGQCIHTGSSCANDHECGGGF